MIILTSPRWYKRIRRNTGVLSKSQLGYGGAHYFREILGIDTNKRIVRKLK